MEEIDFSSNAGEKVFKYVEMMEYPHGNTEKMPVAIIEGEEKGPTFIISANIHGDELNGLVAVQEIIQELEPKEIKGKLIIIPSLNPAGLLLLKRKPFYHDADPNRIWPDPAPKKEPKLIYDDPYDALLDPKNYPQVQELFYKRLAKVFATADYYIDLHTHDFRSIPFTYVDRVYYDPKKGQMAEKAKELFHRTLELAKKFGLTIVLENPPKHYFRHNLQRSTTGSFLNLYRKPAFTVELGPYAFIDRSYIDVAKKGIYNVLVATGMLDRAFEEITEVPVLNNELWREIPIRSNTTGIYVPLVKPGETVKKGTPIIEVRNIFGETKEIIKAPENGAVLAFWGDIKAYINSQLATFLVKNNLDYVFPWEYTRKEKEMINK